jgi:predicted lysophospholipase L1 biosynthesis ABC-type transport system permease subunit
MFPKILLGLLLGLTAGSTAKIVTVERALAEQTLSDKDLSTVRLYAGLSGFAAIAFIIYTFAVYPVTRLEAAAQKIGNLLELRAQ